MKYIGNKSRLLPFIDSVLDELEVPTGLAVDPFSGTASVSRHLKTRGYRVIAGDIQHYALVQGVALVEVNGYPDFRPAGVRSRGEAGYRQALDLLNALPGEDGFFFRNYAPGGSSGARQYFTDANARRIDAVRRRLSAWRDEGLLDREAYCLLLASLLDAADHVANMSGTYGAFLKIWRSVALKPMQLLPISVIRSRKSHRAEQCDAVDLVSRTPCDLLYLDPPYTNRQYATNFHLLETLSVGDAPALRGKTGLRPTAHQLSAFARRREAAAAMELLLAGARARWILLSYSDEGLIPHETVCALLSRHGELRVFEQPFRRFRTERDHENRRYKRPDDRVVERLYAARCRSELAR